MITTHKSITFSVIFIIISCLCLIGVARAGSIGDSGSVSAPDGAQYTYDVGAQSDVNFIGTASASATVGFTPGFEYVDAATSATITPYAIDPTVSYQGTYGATATATAQYSVVASYSDGVDHGVIPLNIFYSMKATGPYAYASFYMRTSNEDTVTKTLDTHNSGNYDLWVPSTQLDMSVNNKGYLYFDLYAHSGATAATTLFTTGGTNQKEVSEAYVDPMISVASGFQFADLVTLQFLNFDIPTVDKSVQYGAVSETPLPPAALMFAPALLGFVGLQRKSKLVVAA